jgi:hypothetical protein
MSKRESVTIKCPSCGQENEFTIWHSINTVLNPEMKDAFKYGTAFQLHCTHCGNTTQVFYSCLYHQMDDKILIYLVGEDSAEEARALFGFHGNDDDSMISDFKKEHYLYRVVTSINALEEKIRIFDAGKDDRAIEIYKKIIRENLSKSNPELKFDKIYYDADDGNSFLLFDQGKYVASAAMDEKLYTDIEKMVSSHCSIRDGADVVIDSEWADSVFSDQD